MNKTENITDSEIIVMKVIWKKERCTAAKIIAEVSKNSDWHFRTIKTLLRNLVKKEVVGYDIDEHDSRIYHYFPLISEEDYLRQERENFTDLYYDGNVGAVVAGFLKDTKLSKYELQDLKRILNNCLGGEKSKNE
ncbi:BlaI/MecI/CopY family transcriptional regulator [Clostridium oryzae]|uniref:Penicillinase repressor n=1 Tax=Clostridium oryzae TaxID=1450648 RepID=A0A1V4ISI6_9CLOT|nr:BlaI/MecI/CopY family transcriptional regulator [Clostridium oryzae]OPJ62886.1 penicillinase repressor [Clostridium oryzae]